MNDINLKQILEQFPDCVTSGTKLKAILIDMYPDAPKAIINTLSIIVNSGIAKEIKSSLDITEIEKSRWKKKLENDYGLSEKVMDSCLNLFLYNSMTSQKSSSSHKSKTTATEESVTSVSNAPTGVKTKPTFVNKNVSVGQIIKFGMYEQDNISNSKTPIEWRVLAVEGNKALIISEKGLDCKPYNTSYACVTWKTCSLRSWLNETFLNSAFTTAEQSKIKSTTVTADKNPNYSTSAGNATTDKIFLLSITEVEKYFTTDEARKCVPTAYAKANGAYTSSDYTKDGESTCCWWWLRSPGNYQDCAARVCGGGSVLYFGFYVSTGNVCVRPALWIKLN